MLCRFLNSLIFNDSVDAYQPWALFFIFVSILVLISGVVLLTHKKPEPSGPPRAPLVANPTRSRKDRKAQAADADDEEADVLRGTEEGDEGSEEGRVVWNIGEASDDEDDGAHAEEPPSRGVGDAYASRPEGVGLMKRSHHEEEEEEGQASSSRGHRRSVSSEATIAVSPPPAGGNSEEFGEWKS